MNSLLKHVAERSLILSGAARFARRRLRHRTLVLAYHNVLADGQPRSGDLSLHLPRQQFARQLDVLGQTHDVIPIGALWDPPGPSGRPRAVITFDDAYADTLTAAVEELVNRGLPATIFVSPALLGAVTWWDVLAEKWGGAVPDALRENALHTLEGRGARILDRAQSGSQLPNAETGLARIGTEIQLFEAARRPGITVGSHSWSHPNLSSLRGAALEAELSRPLQWLQSRFSTAVPWLSYPYGLFTNAVQTAAERIGYSGAFRIDGGWMPRGSFSRYAIPRLNIPAGISIDGFRLRIAGL